MKINNRQIGQNSPPYIIAELSANHNGSLERALDIIKEAKNSGADAIKLQTYKPETITLKSNTKDFIINDNGLWHGRSLYDLYEEAHMPWEWHKDLYAHANKVGITIFSSPFDNSAVDLLEDLNTPAYKVASFEVVDLPLIEYIASTGKPIIISTGMASKEEISEAIITAKDSGCNDIALLHCVSSYPADPKDYNLKTLIDLGKSFDLLYGLSDHTLTNTTALASIALGASIVEKHFTLDRKGNGPDDSFSIEPKELKSLCIEAKSVWESIGRVDYSLKAGEKDNIKFRRSLYFVKDLKAGDLITKDSIRSTRPGYGLKPKYLNEVLGKITKKNIKANTPVSLDLID